MQKLRADRRISTWVAVLAILWMSLAPTLSHAWSGAADGAWTEICSAPGARLVSFAEPDATQPAPSSALLHALDHCPYCALQFGTGAPPSPSFGVVLLPLAFEVPRLFLAAPYTLYAWHHAPSRGPPSFA